jgi:hypothetical protein
VRVIPGESAAGTASFELQLGNGPRPLFLDVPDACPPREVVARLQADRRSRRLAPLLALVKLLLGNRSPDLGHATTDDRRSCAVVWDMSVLFEEYVGRVCQEVFEPKGLDVDLPTGTPSRPPSWSTHTNRARQGQADGEDPAALKGRLTPL